MNRFLVDLSDHQLYHIRIRNRAHIPRLIAALHIPEFIRANNGSVMHGEEAFLLLLYWLSFPRTLASAQEFYGLEYSQLSRFIRAIIRLIMDEWQHLVDDNLDFFAPRFLSYRAAIHRKYIFLHGFVDPKFINTALFSDGTQRQHNRDRRTNFSGHKHFYCYGYLNTVAPDGMIVDISGAFAGRKNDHMKQNESHLSDRLVDCQVGNAIQCNTMTDKGLYLVILNTISFI